MSLTVQCALEYRYSMITLATWRETHAHTRTNAMDSDDRSVNDRCKCDGFRRPFR